MKIFLLFFFITAFTSAQVKKWVNFNKDNSGLPTNAIDFIIQDKNNNYWIGTYDAGLVLFNGKDWKVYNKSNSPLPYNSIRSIAVDSTNIVWIGTYGGGLVEYDNGNWKIFDTKNSNLPDDAVYSISVDSKNNLWMGTSYKGLVKFDRKSFTVYDKSNSILPVNKVTSVYVDKHDRVWAGTTEETIVVDNGKWMTADKLDSTNQDMGIYQITGDNIGRILFAYKFGGLGIYYNKKYISYNLDNSKIPIKGFYSVTSDSNNIIWLGSFEQGIVKFDGTNWEWLNKSNSELKDDLVFYVFTDIKNNKWFCTYFSGLSVFNENGVRF